MAIRLTIADNEAVQLTAGEGSSSLMLNAGPTTVVSENDYEALRNLPSINGVELIGNKTTEDLGIEAGVSSFNGQTGEVTYEAPVASVNGQTGEVTVTEGLVPLIGTTATVTPQQVMTALGEGRDVCIMATATLLGIPVELKFTSFNRATDSQYSGQAIDVVISQTIAVNYTSYYLFELVGGSQNGITLPWTVVSTQLVDTVYFDNSIPKYTSDLTNDSGYITGYTETDPTVPAWAKASTKPTYTASEVGALPSSTVIPSKTSDLINDSGFISEAVMFVNLSKSGSVYTADKTYAEIAGALGNGMMVYVIYNTYSYAYDGNSGTSYFFSCRIIETTKASQTDLTLDISGWSETTYELSATDSKLALTAATSGTAYYPILATNSTGAATRQYDRTGLAYKGTNGTASATGGAALTLGNNTASGSSGNKQGKLVLYGSTAYAHTIEGAPTAARTLNLPDKDGTFALTSDVPTNVSSFTNDAGYLTLADLPVYSGGVS